MRRIKRILLLIAASFTTGVLLFGCGATVKEATETDPLVTAAAAAFGTDFDYMVVEPDSKLGDTLFVGFFGGGPIQSDLSRELFIRLVQAEGEGKPFLVTGPRSEKTALVIIQALNRSPEKSLPDLELLYMGDEEYVDGIQEAVDRVGGSLRFAAYPG